MNKTKIDWCDCTVNPVVGCPNGCEYCYARKLNTRFKWIPEWDKPQYFPERLKAFYEKTPRSIFIDSMSDIGTWRQEWVEQVIDAIKANPQHRYIALTKRPDALSQKLMTILSKDRRKAFAYAGNLFIGTSITTQAQADRAEYAVDFYSVEPILEPIVLPWSAFPKTIIIGAETGNRKGKVIPKREWIEDIVCQAEQNGCTVFMKESLRKIMGEDFRQDRLPWEVKKE